MAAIQLTPGERAYAAEKVRFYQTTPATPGQVERAERHMAGVKQGVSIPADRLPDPSGRIGCLYSWQRNPYE